MSYDWYLEQNAKKSAPMNSKNYTIDAEKKAKEFLDRHTIKVQSGGYTVLDDQNFEQELAALLLRERKAELERLFDANNGVMGSHYIYLTDDAADEIAKALRNRIAELSRLSREESHE